MVRVVWVVWVIWAEWVICKKYNMVSHTTTNIRQFEIRGMDAFCFPRVSFS